MTNSEEHGLSEELLRYEKLWGAPVKAAHVEPAAEVERLRLAESATRHLGECRRELTQLQETLSGQKVHAREALQISGRVDRHVGIIEADLGLLCGDAGSPRERTRAVHDHELNIRLSAERELRDLEEVYDRGLAEIDSLSRSRKNWIAVATGLGCLAFLAVICAGFALFQLSRTPSSFPVASQTRLVIVPPLVSGPDSPGRAAPMAVRADFTKGVDRLDDAVHYFKGEDPEDVLKRIRREYAENGMDVCPFEWDLGRPSLLFSRRQDHAELNALIGTCAEAVEGAVLADRIRRIPKTPQVSAP